MVCSFGASGWGCTVCIIHALRSEDVIRHWFLLSRDACNSWDFIARMMVHRDTPATCAACAGDMCVWCALTVHPAHVGDVLRAVPAPCPAGTVAMGAEGRGPWRSAFRQHEEGGEAGPVAQARPGLAVLRQR